ncbi:hypothetical protein HDU76_000889 [Blyttiomyces sp. JEL0837]|nr:hypothetical protein HDU76_000889 [Blyttiomyces sp. JEL0837]
MPLFGAASVSHIAISGKGGESTSSTLSTLDDPMSSAPRQSGNVNPTPRASRPSSAAKGANSSHASSGPLHGNIQTHPKRDQPSLQLELLPQAILFRILSEITPNLSTAARLSKDWRSLVDKYLHESAKKFKEQVEEAECWGQPVPQLADHIKNHIWTLDPLLLRRILSIVYAPRVRAAFQATISASVSQVAAAHAVGGMSVSSVSAAVTGGPNSVIGIGPGGLPSVNNAALAAASAATSRYLGLQRALFRAYKTTMEVYAVDPKDLTDMAIAQSSGNPGGVGFGWGAESWNSRKPAKGPGGWSLVCPLRDFIRRHKLHYMIPTSGGNNPPSALSLLAAAPNSYGTGASGVEAGGVESTGGDAGGLELGDGAGKGGRHGGLRTDLTDLDKDGASSDDGFATPTKSLRPDGGLDDTEPGLSMPHRTSLVGQIRNDMESPEAGLRPDSEKPNLRTISEASVAQQAIGYSTSRPLVPSLSSSSLHSLPHRRTNSIQTGLHAPMNLHNKSHAPAHFINNVNFIQGNNTSLEQTSHHLMTLKTMALPELPHNHNSSNTTTGHLTIADIRPRAPKDPNWLSLNADMLRIASVHGHSHNLPAIADLDPDLAPQILALATADATRSRHPTCLLTLLDMARLCPGSLWPALERGLDAAVEADEEGRPTCRGCATVLLEITCNDPLGPARWCENYGNAFVSFNANPISHLNSHSYSSEGNSGGSKGGYITGAVWGCSDRDAWGLQRELAERAAIVLERADELRRAYRIGWHRVPEVAAGCWEGGAMRKAAGEYRILPAGKLVIGVVEGAQIGF